MDEMDVTDVAKRAPKTPKEIEEIAKKRQEFLERDLKNSKYQLVVEFHEGDILPQTVDYEDEVNLKIFRTKSREDFYALKKGITALLKKYK